MKIAICASEGAPYAKSGGLGDVMEALPSALARIAGNEVVLFLPYYHKIKTNTAYMVERVAEIRVQLGWRQQYCGIMKLTNRNDGVQVYFLDNDYYFGARTGAIYGDMDDGERFAFFSRGCLDAMIALNFIPEIIQCNDWQTACIPIYLKAMYHGAFYKTRCMYTIHNIEYQGWANAGFFDDVLGLPWEYRSTLDMSNSVNVMKGAIETADAVSTVSETYAQEILYPSYAHGLDGVLSGFRYKIFGITNGIDTDVFNPATDKAIVCHYDKDSFKEGKAENKRALQEELGLPQRPDVPMMAMVTRLAGHKGLDLLCYTARRLLEQDVQLVVVGTGEEKYEYFLRCLQADYPNKVSAQLCFNISLASRVYAGADIYLMPSKSEPCGLSQMNAMRYGTVPVVNATGGLKDTVAPVNSITGEGLGYTFQSYNGDDFYGAMDRALGLYRFDRADWDVLVRRDMEQDFGWRIPAQKYMAMFQTVCSWQ